MMLEEKEWSNDYVKQVDNYVHSLIVSEQIFLCKIFRRKQRSLKTKGRNQPNITKKHVTKLHHIFGHAHPEKLKSFLQRAGHKSPEIYKYLEDLKSCEVCRVEGRRIPKPKIAMPKATNHNHMVGIELRENRRYPKAPPCIIYMVDTFTRWKAAIYIKDKKATTVTEAICKEWVKIFGPMKYMLVDRGREWLNQELQNFCHFHDIRLITTASYIPNANGLVERIHACVDRMLEKICTAQSDLNPEIALCWALHASNCLELVDGISPHLLVFGKIPQHPSLWDYKQGNRVDLPMSDKMAQHVDVRMKAREAFANLEADKALRQALNQRIYTNSTDIHVHDWIYYKNNISKIWKGPVKVSAKEGKRIYVLSAGQLITINSDDVLLSKSEENVFTQGGQFITLPTASTASTQDEDTGEQNEHSEQNDNNSYTGHEHTSNTAPEPETETQVGYPVQCNVCKIIMSSKLIDRPRTGQVIPTDWVILEKENEDKTITIKARLVMRGDLERNKHLIPTDSPTINKVTLRLIMAIAAAKGWNIQCSDITRAFLQTENLDRGIYVLPPRESQLPGGKVWKHRGSVYSLIDASRAFFLRHAAELNKIGFKTISMDPAAYILHENNS